MGGRATARSVTYLAGSPRASKVEANRERWRGRARLLLFCSSLSGTLAPKLKSKHQPSKNVALPARATRRALRATEERLGAVRYHVLRAFDNHQHVPPDPARHLCCQSFCSCKRIAPLLAARDLQCRAQPLKLNLVRRHYNPRRGVSHGRNQRLLSTECPRGPHIMLQVILGVLQVTSSRRRSNTNQEVMQEGAPAPEIGYKPQERMRG